MLHPGNDQGNVRIRRRDTAGGAIDIASAVCVIKLFPKKKN